MGGLESLESLDFLESLESLESMERLESLVKSGDWKIEGPLKEKRLL